MGAPTEPGSSGSLFSRTAATTPLLAVSRIFLSWISTTRGIPLTSKNTSRLPLGNNSPTALSLSVELTPRSVLISISSSMSRPLKNALVGSKPTGPSVSRLTTNSSKTLGYNAADNVSLCVTERRPVCFKDNSDCNFCKSKSGIVAPGRPSMMSLPLTTRERRGSGKPPTG